MDQSPDNYQAPEPAWNERHGDVEVIRLLKSRIVELEAENKAYQDLLADLPDLFERKFQQRLEPLMERYRLLARAQQLMSEADLPSIEQSDPQESDNHLPLLERWRQARKRGQQRSERNAA